MDNTVQSEDYELYHLIKENIDCFDRNILFDTLNKNFLAGTNSDNINNNEISVIWKINSKGEIIDSIALRDGYYLDEECGIIRNNIKDDHFLDWINTGDKNKKSYSEIINEDSSLTRENWDNQFKELYNKAQTAINGYEHKWIFNIDNSWILFYGLKNDDRFNNYNSEEYKKYPSKSIYWRLRDDVPMYVNQFLRLNSEVEASICTRDEPNPYKNYRSKLLSEAFFLYGKRVYPSLFSLGINGTDHLPGYHGIGFINLAYNNEILKFKTYAYKDNSFPGFNAQITVYNLPEKYNKDADILFLYLERHQPLSYFYNELEQYQEKRGFYRSQNISYKNEGGLYVVRKKLAASKK